MTILKHVRAMRPGKTLFRSVNAKNDVHLPHALHSVSLFPVTGSVFTLGDGWCRDLFVLNRCLLGLQTYGDLHRSQQNAVPTKDKILPCRCFELWLCTLWEIVKVFSYARISDSDTVFPLRGYQPCFNWCEGERVGVQER